MKECKLSVKRVSPLAQKIFEKAVVAFLNLHEAVYFLHKSGAAVAMANTMKSRKRLMKSIIMPFLSGHVHKLNFKCPIYLHSEKRRNEAFVVQEFKVTEDNSNNLST